MDIKVRQINGEYKEVTVFSLNTSLCSGFLDREKQRELVIAFKNAIEELENE